jgi:hypothetical protein
VESDILGEDKKRPAVSQSVRLLHVIGVTLMLIPFLPQSIQAPTKPLLQQLPYLDEAFSICTDILRDLALHGTKYATFARIAYTIFPIIINYIVY